jgi:hypothetical protein
MRPAARLLLTVMCLGVLSTAASVLLCSVCVDPCGPNESASTFRDEEQRLIIFAVDTRSVRGASRVVFGKEVPRYGKVVYPAIEQAILEQALRTLELARKAGAFPPRWADVNTALPPIAGGGTTATPLVLRDHTIVVDARGWPMLATWCEWREASSGSDPLGPVAGGVGIAPSPPGLAYPWTARAIPLRPIWSGFGANTLFYAGTWWVAIWGWGAARWGWVAARRRIRLGRELCAHCAYNLRGLPLGSLCPECGHRRQG